MYKKIADGNKDEAEKEWKWNIQYDRDTGGWHNWGKRKRNS